MNVNTLHVVCAQCGGVNRVPESRLGDGPRCAACKTALFQGKPLPLDDENFERHIARSDVPVLVDFWAGWCGPCKTMAPVFAAAAAQLEPRVRLVKVDVDASPRSTGQLWIQSIPTLCLFVNGREIARQSGAMPLGALVRWVEETLQHR